MQYYDKDVSAEVEQDVDEAAGSERGRHVPDVRPTARRCQARWVAVCCRAPCRHDLENVLLSLCVPRQHGDVFSIGWHRQLWRHAWFAGQRELELEKNVFEESDGLYCNDTRKLAFMQVMHMLSLKEVPQVLAAVDFSKYSTVCDLGGKPNASLLVK